MDKLTELRMKRKELEEAGREVLDATKELDPGRLGVVEAYVSSVNNCIRDLEAHLAAM